MIIAQLEAAFYPRSIAIVGASGNPFSMGYRYVAHLVNYGYQGKIYPVTPSWSEVANLKAYPALRDIPNSVDYVICCLPASKVLDILPECHQKNVKVMHLFTGRFSETGREEASRLEKELLRRARELGIRLLGPNCMGIYHPKEGIAFGYDFPREPGKVGMFLQSGGLATEFVRYASTRGIRFSKVVSYGNALDLNESDFLEYFARDSETKIIATYIEGLREGKRFFNILSNVTFSKPVIILKAGRGTVGSRAAFSHTAVLAGSFKTWEAAIGQAGAIQVRTLEEMMNLVVAFYLLPPLVGTRVGMIGGGGGRSVLSADEWEEAGFNLVPLSPEIEEEIRKNFPELWWGWIKNPVDVSIFPEEFHTTNLGRNLLKKMAQSPDYDLLVVNITTGGPFSNAEFAALINTQVEGILEVSKLGIKPLVVVLDTSNLDIRSLDNLYWKSLAEQKTRLITAGIPVFSTAIEAAKAAFSLVRYYQKKKSLTP